MREGERRKGEGRGEREGSRVNKSERNEREEREKENGLERERIH